MSTSQKEPLSETGRGIDIAFWQVSGFVIGLMFGPASLAALSLLNYRVEAWQETLMILLTPFLGALGGVLGTMWALRDRRK